MRVVVEVNFDKHSFNLFINSFNHELGLKYDLKCNFYLEEEKPRMGVFVSKYDHCLYDILFVSNQNCTTLLVKIV